ncbi:hypothetical protein BpHYR1_009634 [Brachionus plicatilis]|uniref:Uncharacterized protein n=1 Tax=Brachionus plicatilis TaxID=10195 RepID=A0A3M7SYC6_BRAPC|nr:hypothetical protein BpHYR1_009634 [Brachionus plicatilis]
MDLSLCFQCFASIFHPIFVLLWWPRKRLKCAFYRKLQSFCRALFTNCRVGGQNIERRNKK